LRSPRALAAVFTAVAVLVVPAVAAAAPARPHTAKVMTRNLYLGGDIMRPLDAFQHPFPGLDGPTSFAIANFQLFGVVTFTNFPARAEKLAAEIATEQPDLVGLQEVATWSHGPLQLPGQPGFAEPNATIVDYDFLEILLDELEEQGQDYDVVENQTESDVEGPALNPTNPAASFDARLTMHDVILRRVDGVKVLDSGSAQYDTSVDFSVAGAQFSFIRGYNWADVVVDHQKFRFINTHLESLSSDVALGQAQELLAGPAALRSKPVVLVCDCNSDPLNGDIKPTDTVAHWAPYRLLTGSGGFTDEWLQFAPAEEGWTSGLSEFVNDSPAEALARFDHRIDMVFGRRPSGKPIPVVDATVVGRDPAQRTAGGLWPSDHAGVVAELAP
jgi:endonuclease/exonuclease/phosphatase family metal-dependent hydrolase